MDTPIVFISYSSKHRDLTADLAEAIEAQYGAGSVWWDHALESWGSYEVQIRNAVHAARAVVVIWSKAAGESDWVKSEAARANRDNKLVNVRPNDTSWRDVPAPYDQHHVEKLENRDAILRGIETVRSGKPLRTIVPLYEIYERHHGRALLDPKHALPADPHDISPTMLLQAKYGVVPYDDVTGTAAALLAWCEDAARPTAGRLVHGPGGLGKTRLAIHAAAELRAKGWIAGFLDRPDGLSPGTITQRREALEQLVDHGDAGLLVIIDYAEARQDEVRILVERLCKRPSSAAHPVRLVLLARGAGDWWPALRDESPEIQRLFRDDTHGPAVVAMPAVATGGDRAGLFRESVRRFAPLLAAQGFGLPQGEPPSARLERIEAGSGYARPLAVQMEALLWLAAASPQGATARVEDLLARVLGLERGHWRKLLGALDDDAMRDMARGVAQATTVQGTASAASTERLLAADPFQGGQRTTRGQLDPLLRRLSRIYGRADGGVAHVEPDLVGEHHVATVADAELIDGCLRWIEAEPEEARARQRRDLLTLLQRATQPEHGSAASERAAALLDHVIAAHAGALATDMVAVMIDTPGRLAERLGNQVESLDDEALGAIDATLPLQSLALMDLSFRIAARRAGLARNLVAADAAKNPPALRGAYRPLLAFVERLKGVFGHGRTPLSEADVQAMANSAARQVTLGLRLSALGRREEALAATQEAVNTYRTLAKQRPDAFLPDLAMSLGARGSALAAAERHADAAAAFREGASVIVPFVERLPQAFGGLAQALISGYAAACEEAGIEPDAALVATIARALGE